MKKIFFILVVALLTSCGSIAPIVTFTDYSEYSRNGMFLTESNSVNFQYEPIGSVSALMYSQYVPVTENSSKEQRGEDVYFSSPYGTRKYQSATVKDVIDLIVHEAQTKGANAIINLKYEYIPATKGQPSAWFVSGMAIKK